MTKLAKDVSIQEALVEVVVVVDATVAQEGPPASHLLAALHVDVDDLQVLGVVGCAVDEFALGPGYKAAAPELDAIGLS